MQIHNQPQPLSPLVVEVSNLLLSWVRALVEAPELVALRAVEGHVSVIFEVAPGPDDAGRLLGKDGRTAEALRDLLVCVGAKHGRRFLLEILTPTTPPGSDPVPRAARGVRVKSVHQEHPRVAAA